MQFAPGWLGKGTRVTRYKGAAKTKHKSIKHIKYINMNINNTNMKRNNQNNNNNN